MRTELTHIIKVLVIQDNRSTCQISFSLNILECLELIQNIIHSPEVAGVKIVSYRITLLLYHTLLIIFWSKKIHWLIIFILCFLSYLPQLKINENVTVTIVLDLSTWFCLHNQSGMFINNRCQRANMILYKKVNIVSLYIFTWFCLYSISMSNVTVYYKLTHYANMSKQFFT